MSTKVLGLVWATLLCLSCQKPAAVFDDFVRGADMSFLPEITASGYNFKNNGGQIENPLLTLKKSGVNIIRIRVWNNANHPVSSPRLAKRLADECRQIGLRVMLSLHYSDTWADPGHQQKPALWQHLGLDALRDSLYHFTYRISSAIQPDYIQIGNEVNGGFLWPEGAIANTGNFILLLKAGLEAAKKGFPQTKTIIHYAGVQGASDFFEKLNSLNYDVVGLSYYPYWHGSNIQVLQQGIQQLKMQTRRQVMIVETAYPFTLQWNDQTQNVIGLSSQLLPGFPATLQGQRDYVCLIRQITQQSGAAGFCYWGAEWVSYKGQNANNGSSWENQALWDFDGFAVPAMECFGMAAK